jgi:TonB family protein
LLTAAERTLTAGNVDDARRMVAVAETLTPATARAAFLTMQIERESEREALKRSKDSDALDKLAKGATYLRLAQARLRSGALIEPSEDNARFYVDAATQLIPDDPALIETRRGLQKALLDRASAAASEGNAAETERWLANADDAGAARADMAAIRRSLKDTEIGARAGKMAALAQSFTNALAANRLVQPQTDCAKTHLLGMINIDGGHPAVASARQGLGNAYLGEFRGALSRGDLNAADTWLHEARTIGYSGNDLKTAEGDLGGAREKAVQRAVVGEKTLERTEYVPPKFPSATRNRGISGWVELEFSVLPDGSTGDIVVTNSNPRKTFDSAAITAVSQWRYRPVMRDGKTAEQRVAVRIRFADQ